MIDASLHLPSSFLHKAFSDRSGVPLGFFELYYRGKRLEGEATLASWGVGKDSTIEVKMRGRGGTGNEMGKQPQKPDESPLSPSKVEAQKNLSQNEAATSTPALALPDTAKVENAAKVENMEKVEAKTAEDAKVAKVPDAAGGGDADLLSIEGAPGSSGSNESSDGGRRGRRSSCGSQARAAEEASVQEASAATLDALDNILTDPSNKDTVKDTVVPAPRPAAGSGAGGGLSAGTTLLHHASTDETSLHDLLESKEHGGVGASAEKVLQMLKAHPEAASISKKNLNLPLHIAARKFRGSGALDVVKALIHAYPDGPKQKGGVLSSL